MPAVRPATLEPHRLPGALLSTSEEEQAAPGFSAEPLELTRNQGQISRYSHYLPD